MYELGGKSVPCGSPNPDRSGSPDEIQQITTTEDPTYLRAPRENDAVNDLALPSRTVSAEETSLLSTTRTAAPPCNHGPSEISSESSHTTPSFTSRAMSPGYFLLDLRQALEHAMVSVQGWYAKVGLSAQSQALLTTSAGLGWAGAFMVAPTITSGVAAVSLWQMATYYEKNRHGRALSIIAGSLYCLHSHGMGFHALAMCSFAGTARSLVQSMIADDRPVIRGAVAAMGFAATSVAFFATSASDALLTLENVPLVTLGLGSLSGAFSERYSWASRVANLTAISLSLAYHLAVTQSFIGLFANSIFLPGTLWSIWKYDLAKESAPSSELTTSESEAE